MTVRIKFFVYHFNDCHMRLKRLVQVLNAQIGLPQNLRCLFVFNYFNFEVLVDSFQFDGTLLDHLLQMLTVFHQIRFSFLALRYIASDQGNPGNASIPIY